MEVRDLGVMEYGECLELQRSIWGRLRVADADNTVLVVEHPPVATLGRRGEDGEVFDKTLPVYKIERGGKATYHGPGQLVVYPIVHLGEGNRDVRAWVRHLEQFLHDCLTHFGIDSVTKEDYPGVWTVATDKKIASIGIAIKDWVSFHGIALNVTLEPKEFERIDPCGLGAAVMTNMVAEGAPVDMAAVKAWVLEHAAAHFLAFRKRDDGESRMQQHFH